MPITFHPNTYTEAQVNQQIATALEQLHIELKQKEGTPSGVLEMISQHRHSYDRRVTISEQTSNLTL